MSLKSLFRRDDGSFKPAAIALIVVVAVLSGFVPIGIVAGFGIYDIIANGPEAARVQTELEHEFRAISPLPGATSQGVQASHKPRIALVQGTYCTSLKYEEIRNYYDKELQVHGWAFYKEKKM